MDMSRLLKKRRQTDASNTTRSPSSLSQNGSSPPGSSEGGNGNHGSGGRFSSGYKHGKSASPNIHSPPLSPPTAKLQLPLPLDLGLGLGGEGIGGGRDDFRSSMIMSSLSKRFSVLRPQTPPTTSPFTTNTYTNTSTSTNNSHNTNKSSTNPYSSNHPSTSSSSLLKTTNGGLDLEEIKLRLAHQRQRARAAIAASTSQSNSSPISGSGSGSTPLSPTRAREPSALNNAHGGLGASGGHQYITEEEEILVLEELRLARIEEEQERELERKRIASLSLSNTNGGNGINGGHLSPAAVILGPGVGGGDFRKSPSEWSLPTSVSGGSLNGQLNTSGSPGVGVGIHQTLQQQQQQQQGGIDQIQRHGQGYSQRQPTTPQSTTSTSIPTPPPTKNKDSQAHALLHSMAGFSSSLSRYPPVSPPTQTQSLSVSPTATSPIGVGTSPSRGLVGLPTSLSQSSLSLSSFGGDRSGSQLSLSLTGTPTTPHTAPLQSSIITTNTNTTNTSFSSNPPSSSASPVAVTAEKAIMSRSRSYGFGVGLVGSGSAALREEEALRKGKKSGVSSVSTTNQPSPVSSGIGRSISTGSMNVSSSSTSTSTSSPSHQLQLPTTPQSQSTSISPGRPSVTANYLSQGDESPDPQDRTSWVPPQPIFAPSARSSPATTPSGLISPAPRSSSIGSPLAMRSGSVSSSATASGSGNGSTQSIGRSKGKGNARKSLLDGLSDDSFKRISMALYQIEEEMNAIARGEFKVGRGGENEEDREEVLGDISNGGHEGSRPVEDDSGLIGIGNGMMMERGDSTPGAGTPQRQLGGHHSRKTSITRSPGFHESLASLAARGTVEDEVPSVPMASYPPLGVGLVTSPKLEGANLERKVSSRLGRNKSVSSSRSGTPTLGLGSGFGRPTSPAQPALGHARRDSGTLPPSPLFPDKVGIAGPPSPIRQRTSSIDHELSQFANLPSSAPAHPGHNRSMSSNPVASEEMLDSEAIPRQRKRSASSSAAPVSRDSIVQGYVPGAARPFTPPTTSESSSQGASRQPFGGSLRERNHPGDKRKELFIRPPLLGSSLNARSVSGDGHPSVSPVAETFEGHEQGRDGPWNIHSALVGSPLNQGEVSVPNSALMDAEEPYEGATVTGEGSIPQDQEDRVDALSFVSLGSSYNEMDHYDIDSFGFEQIDTPSATTAFSSPARDSKWSSADIGGFTLDDLLQMQDKLVSNAKEVRKEMTAGREDHHPKSSVPAGLALRPRPSVRARKVEQSTFIDSQSADRLARAMSPTTSARVSPEVHVPGLQRQTTTSSTMSSNFARTPSTANDHAITGLVTEDTNAKFPSSTSYEELESPASPVVEAQIPRSGSSKQALAEALFGPEQPASPVQPGHRRQESYRLEDDPLVRQQFEAKIAEATAALKSAPTVSRLTRKNTKGKAMVISGPQLVGSSSQISAKPISAPLFGQEEVKPLHVRKPSRDFIGGHLKAASISRSATPVPLQDSLGRKGSLSRGKGLLGQEGSSDSTGSGLKGLFARLRPHKVVDITFDSSAPAVYPVKASELIQDNKRHPPKLPENVARAFDIPISPVKETEQLQLPSRVSIVRRTIVLAQDPTPVPNLPTPSPELASGSLKKTPSTRRKPVQPLMAEPKLPTEPPQSETLKTPPPSSPVRNRNVITFPGTSGDRESYSGSLLDMYMEDREDEPRRSMASSARRSQAVEIFEMSDGRVMYNVLNNLPPTQEEMDSYENSELDEQDSIYADSRPESTVVPSGQAQTESGVQLRIKGAAPSNDTSGLGALRRLLPTSGPRPETKVYFSSSAQVADLIDDLSKNLDHGKIEFMPSNEVQSPPHTGGVQSSMRSAQSQVSGDSAGSGPNQSVEHRLQALLDRMQVTSPGPHRI